MITNFSKFNFLNEAFNDPANPLGPDSGYASDPTMNVYSDGSNNNLDNYGRMSQIVGDLARVMKSLTGQGVFADAHKADLFLEEVDEYKNIKILRIYENLSRKLDIFISFEFMEEEFFGVYRSYNDFLTKSKLNSDITKDPRLRHIDRDYYLKLNNYFYRILEKWFVPSKGLYKNMKEDNLVKDEMGQMVKLKKNAIIEVIGTNIDKDNEPYIILKYKNQKFTITKNSYYYFKYWFKK